MRPCDLTIVTMLEFGFKQRWDGEIRWRSTREHLLSDSGGQVWQPLQRSRWKQMDGETPIKTH